MSVMSMGESIKDDIDIIKEKPYGYDPIIIPFDVTLTLTLIHQSMTTQIYQHQKKQSNKGGNRLAQWYGTVPTTLLAKALCECTSN